MPYPYPRKETGPMPTPAVLAGLTNPDKKKQWLLYANAVLGDIFDVYPDREFPHPFVATRNHVVRLLKDGEATADELIRCARNYRTECEKEMKAAKWVIGPVRFFGERIWTRYKQVTVEGRTREEWARSGQDVAEFDRLAEGLAALASDDATGAL